MLSYLGFIVLGFFSGISSGLFGIGGGTIIVPSLIFMGYEISYAIGISIVQMIFASFFGTYLNYKKQLVDFQNGIILGIGGMIGSSFSGSIVSLVNPKILNFAFLCFTLFSFLKYFFFAKKHYQKTTIPIWKRIFVLVCAGALTGVFASSLGIGGGLLLAPILGYFLGLNSKQVVPLALFFICFSSISGSISLYQKGFVELESGLLVGLASIMGVYFGIYIISKITEKTHKTILACIYLGSIFITTWKIF